MKKSLAITIAAAALIAGAGLATAQQTNMPGGTSKSTQGPTYQGQSAGPANPTKAEPGAVQKSPAKQGRSAVKAKKHHYGSHAWMQSPAQGRSAAEKNKQPAGQPAPKASSTGSPSTSNMKR
jgi:hypothetical protein